MNERRVLRTVQTHGAMSRAEVARHLGLSVPSVGKAVSALVRSGLIEETDSRDPVSPAAGRPGMKLRPATVAAQVIGVVIDVHECHVVSAGLDGVLRPDGRAVPTPATYEELMTVLRDALAPVAARPGITTLGIGLSLPGLIDLRTQRGVLSPNVPMTDGRSPAEDLGGPLGIPYVTYQESHALCLAERDHGGARGLDTFAMFDISTGIGLGVVSGGQLLTGNSGMAGEVGHITVAEDGRPCGCGNRGCLETLAGDTAFARRVSHRLGRPTTLDQALRLAREGGTGVADDVRETLRYLAIGVGAVINLYNPSNLFVHGRLFEAGDWVFDELVELTRRRALRPSFAECRMMPARGSKRHGAVAGIIQYLADSIGPSLERRDR